MTRTRNAAYSPPGFEFPAAEEFARRLDAEDPLAPFRERFHIPPGPGGEPLAYFCGNSLGLQPRGAREAVEREIEDWARLGVDAHFRARSPWYPYHERFREPLGRILGARTEEVIVMNGLTVNLHLMMATFYRPTPERHRILIEDRPFPSDLYAVRAQARLHGLDPDAAVLTVKPRRGEDAIRTGDVEAAIRESRPRIALVFLSAVHYLTGQWFDLERITAAAREAGCAVGFNLAHAAGNVPLRFHDWGADFAVWCGYKYLNAGPGAAAGCFVHERHGRDPDLFRLAGWWGDDPETRFAMDRKTEFVPRPGADGWQVSNPPILALAPLGPALDLFDAAGMEALRAKSVRLTAYLQAWLNRLPPDRFRLITPPDPERRGCQLSLRVAEGARAISERLGEAGFVVDFREPDVIRIAPVPFYNRFHEVWRLGRHLLREAGADPDPGETRR